MTGWKSVLAVRDTGTRVFANNRLLFVYFVPVYIVLAYHLYTRVTKFDPTLRMDVTS